MNMFNVVNDILISFLDIFSVSILIYVFIKLISKSRQNVQIITTILFFGIIYLIAHILKLQTLSFILSQIYSWGIIVIVIIFQKEIRNSLEKIGSWNEFFSNHEYNENNNVENLAKAVYKLSATKTGSIIVLEKNDSLDEYIENAISINADFSSYLIETIFFKNTPLHDGAIIIRGEKIVCASAYFPISIDLNLEQKYGTRHRAGVTISSLSDAIAIITSEETGTVSVAYNGNLYENLEYDFFVNLIKEKWENYE